MVLVRRIFLTTSVFAIGLLTAPPTSAQGASEVVVFGAEKVEIKKNVDVASGSVIVNDSGGELKIDENVTTPAGFDLKADEVEIKKDSIIGGDVHYNSLDNDGTILGSEITPLALPVLGSLPAFFTGPSNGPDVDVDKNESLTLAAGDYGKIKVDEGGTLTFSGGIYNVEEIEAKKDAVLDFSAATEIRVAKAVKLDERVTAGSATVPASDIIFYVDDGDVEIKKEGVVGACFYAPNKKIEIDKDVNATGAFFADEVKIDKDSQISLDSCFANKPPVAVDDDDNGNAFVTPEDGQIVDIPVLANDSDPDGDNLSITATPAAPFGVVTINDNGTPGDTNDDTLTYTPNPGSNDNEGNHSFDYEVCDDGTDPGPLCDTATVLISVTPVNDAPIANDQSVSTDEDVALGIMLTGDDGDPHEVQVLTFAIATPPAKGVLSGLDPSTGAVTYTPNPNENGADSFTFTVSDDAAAGGPALTSAPATVSITINPIADPPDAVDDQYAGTEDTQLDVVAPGVLGNDTDPDNDPLSVSASDSTSANGGAVSVAADGSFSYTPAADFCGEDTFNYTASDGSGTDSAVVTIDVACVNDAPVAADDVASVDENDTVVIDVLANDADVDNPPAELTVSLDPGAAENGITTDGSSVTYSPIPNFSGETRFNYTVCDLEPLCDSAEVVVTVNDVGEAPTATVGIEAVTNGDVDIQIILSGTDPNGDSLEFTVISGPSAGVLTGLPFSDLADPLAEATVTYNPNTGDDVEDSFIYQVDDGSGVDTAEVLINPGAESEPPPELEDLVAFDQATQTFMDEGIAILLEGDAPCESVPNSPDPDDVEPCDGIGNDVPLNFLVGSVTAEGGVLGSVVQGTEVPQRSATVQYMPPAGFTGVDSFTFTVEGEVDGSPPLETGTATVQIDVQPRVSIPPVVALDQGVVTEKDVPVEIDLSGVDSGGVSGPHGPASAAPGASAVVAAGGGPSPNAAITVGGGWNQFEWDGSVPGVFATDVATGDGEYTFTGPGCVTVTDDFNRGEQFRVYANGFPIPIVDSGFGTPPPPGETPVVPVAEGSALGIGPDAAFLEVGYSSLTFEVNAGGTQEITIELIGLSASTGQGYIRVDPLDSPACRLGEPTFTIESLPTQGSLSFGTGIDTTPITSVPFQLPVFGGIGLGLVIYTPPAGVTGGDFATQTPLTSFDFGLSDGFSSDSATVDLYVVEPAVVPEECTFNGRQVNCNGGGGQAPAGAPAPAGLPSGSALTVSVTGPGFVASSRPVVDGQTYLGILCSPDSDCSANFVEGTPVALFARPDDGSSEFAGWGGDCGGFSPVAVVQAGRDVLCTATFRKIEQ